MSKTIRASAESQERRNNFGRYQNPKTANQSCVNVAAVDVTVIAGWGRGNLDRKNPVATCYKRNCCYGRAPWEGEDQMLLTLSP